MNAKSTMKNRQYVFSAVIWLSTTVGLVISGCGRPLGHPGKTVNEVNIESIVLAIQSYEAWYGKLPITALQTNCDIEVINSNIVAVLTASTGTAEVARFNPEHEDFIDITARFLSNSIAIDPWGNAYRFALDANGNGRVTVSGRSIPGRIAVWSIGPNGRDDAGLGDDTIKVAR